MRQLIARRPMTYGTRRLLANDEFSASARDAKILIALKRAGPAEAKVVQVDPLEAARAAYQEKFGKAPAKSWKLEKIEAKFAEAGGS